MLWWTLVVVGVSLLPVAADISGSVYFISAAVLGVWFSGSAVQLVRNPTEKSAARKTFSYSMLYLALLFVALAVDAALS